MIETESANNPKMTFNDITGYFILHQIQLEEWKTTLRYRSNLKDLNTWAIFTVHTREKRGIHTKKKVRTAIFFVFVKAKTMISNLRVRQFRPASKFLAIYILATVIPANTLKRLVIKKVESS